MCSLHICQSLAISLMPLQVFPISLISFSTVHCHVILGSPSIALQCPLTCLVFFRSPLIIVHLVFPLLCLFLIDSKRNNVFHFYAASFLKDWSVNLYFRMACGFTSILIVITSWMLTVLKRRIRWELTWYSVEITLTFQPHQCIFLIHYAVWATCNTNLWTHH